MVRRRVGVKKKKPPRHVCIKTTARESRASFPATGLVPPVAFHKRQLHHRLLSPLSFSSFSLFIFSQ